MSALCTETAIMATDDGNGRVAALGVGERLALAAGGLGAYGDTAEATVMSAQQDRKQLALIARWRQAANEATTSDAAVTYMACANELAALAPHVLIAACEGCGVEIPMPTNNARKVNPDLPMGWSQSGVSKYRLPGRPAGSRLAAWCPACRAKRASGERLALAGPVEGQ